MIHFHLLNMEQSVVCCQLSETCNSFYEITILIHVFCFVLFWRVIQFNRSFTGVAALIESDAEGIGGSGFVECIREHIHSVCSYKSLGIID